MSSGPFFTPRTAQRQRKAAEFEAEQRREAALEHRWELERRGVEAHTVDEALQVRGSRDGPGGSC
jgi:hypothetical protein